MIHIITQTNTYMYIYIYNHNIFGQWPLADLNQNRNKKLIKLGLKIIKVVFVKTERI